MSSLPPRFPSGIHTVEGTVSGSRAASLSAARDKSLQDFEEKKRQLQSESSRGVLPMAAKFEVLKEGGGGGGEAKTKPEAAKDGAEVLAAAPVAEAGKKKDGKSGKEKRRLQLSTLSFGVDDEQGEGVDSSFDGPSASTDFLPDSHRTSSSLSAALALRSAWESSQSAQKSSQLLIVYSYWDGSGHRREATIKKGSTVSSFLDVVCKDLSKDFKELCSCRGEDLLYVKEDLIIPSDVTFYDLIALQARGKSGPLFNFDVREDVRVGAVDSRVERDESHPGKVVERRWFEKNKHIFPASRWEVWEAGKDYGSYNIRGGELEANKKR